MDAFSDKPWPDLEALTQEVQIAACENHEQKISLSNTQLAGDKPLYYSFSIISGQEQKLYSTE